MKRPLTAADRVPQVGELGEWVAGIPRCLEERHGLFRIQIYNATNAALQQAQEDLDGGRRRLRAWMERLDDYQRDVDRELGRRQGRAEASIVATEPERP